MAVCNSPEVAAISLRRRRGVSFEHVPFFILYAFALYQCYETFGEPFRLALEKAADESGLKPCMPLPSEYVPSFMSRLYLGATVVLHCLLLLLQHWSVGFLCWLKYPECALREARFVKVTPPAHKGKAALAPLVRNKAGEIYFEFQKFKFFYSPLTEEFAKIGSPDALQLSAYINAPGLASDEVREAAEHFGLNEFKINMPSFGDMYLEGLLSPFTVFQMFCILLWCLDEYWQYSLFTGSMMLVFEGTVVMSRRKNLQTLRGMNNEPRKCMVKRDGVWERTSARNLVPGDLVILNKLATADGDVVPCDCLVLRGSAVVNEASLTGESVPQIREAIPRDEASHALPLDVKGLHRVHVLFGGTRLMQVTPDEEDLGTEERGCLCYVLRTGFDSSQGQMVRMIEFSSEKVSGNTIEALMLVLFLLIFAISASGYVLKKGIEEGRDQFDLLLHCILIITSVIPPELNMQLALAVNSALLALLRLHIFCTEPFRIPLAGKIDVCLFDKTGTITTDELVAAGGVAWPLASASAAAAAAEPKLEPMLALPLEGALVVAACHSLVSVDGKTTGDPLELAALQAIQWQYDAEAQTSRPATGSPLKSKASVRILHRHHFASRLQRMCTVARVTEGDKHRNIVLVKGSAEMVGAMLGSDSGQPNRAWYESAHRALAERGLRVIALAWAPFPAGIAESKISDVPRESYETNLRFAGFIAFRCLLRKDSAQAILALRESAHKTIMITGDALLTGIHVASEVNMLTKERAVSLQDREGVLVWVGAQDKAVAPLRVAELPRLATTNDLCITGPALIRAVEEQPDIWKHMQHFSVFARMTPEHKEQVLVELKAAGCYPLMCGDGANDVGALKQAVIGVALLSGFGSANAARPVDGTAAPPPNVIATTAAAAAVPVAPKKLTAEQQRERLRVKMEEVELNIKERERRGESWARMKEMYAFAQREAEEKRREVSKHQNITTSAAALLETDDGSVPMIKLGDASAAAPFTVKLPSIAAAIGIIRQGRCTLVTSLQMYQILALNCLISSYSLSVLYLDGVKNGDRQMTLLGLVITVSYLSLSRAKPREKMGPVRPLTSIFHPALFVSLLSQFAIHLFCMYSTVALVKPHLPPNFVPNPDGKFEPNLINSVVFLMTCMQQVTVFAVNYKGPPFMDGLAQNNLLIGSLAFVAVVAAVAAANTFPILNTGLQLVEYPTTEFRSQFLSLMMLNVVGVFLVDRLAVGIFAPRLLMEDLKQVPKDLWKISKVFVGIFLLVGLFAQEPPPEVLEASSPISS